MNVARPFDPDGIAVVGASATAGKTGDEAMANAVEFDGGVALDPVVHLGEGVAFGEGVV